MKWSLFCNYKQPDKKTVETSNENKEYKTLINAL